MWYILGVEFRHRGLRRFWERDDASRLNPANVARISRILDNLEDAVGPRDIDLPGYNLHQLHGNRRGVWSVRVTGNWRITFRFSEGQVVDVNLEDYH